MKWFNCIVENMTNGVWFYAEIKAKNKADARQQIASCFKCTSGHCIEIRSLKKI